MDAQRRVCLPKLESIVILNREFPSVYRYYEYFAMNRRHFSGSWTKNHSASSCSVTCLFRSCHYNLRRIRTQRKDIRLVLQIIRSGKTRSSKRRSLPKFLGVYKTTGHARTSLLSGRARFSCIWRPENKILLGKSEYAQSAITDCAWRF